MTIVFGWKHTSDSAKKLAGALDAQFANPKKYIPPKKGEFIINWGGANMNWEWANQYPARIINRPQAIARSVNKLDTFRLLNAAGCPTPEWTTNPEKALRWIKEGHVVYGRRLLEARTGKGIVLLTGPNNQVENGYPCNDLEDVLRYKCTAYTKRFKGKWEFKIHVAFSKVCWVWEVAKEIEDWYDHDDIIRNYDNGYYFRYISKVLQERLHPSVHRHCVNACKALGLDFCVVDCQVAANGKDMVIFETNTAPAMDYHDATLYAKMFRRELGIK